MGERTLLLACGNRNGFSLGKRPFCSNHMQFLDNFTIDHGDAAALGLGLMIGLDLAAGEIDLGIGGRKDLVGDGNLGGVDERLAVKTHVAALIAFGTQALVILEGVVDAVDDDAAVGLARQKAERDGCQERLAVGAVAGADVLGEIVGADDKASDAGMGSDVGGVPGYAEYLAALADPNYPDRDEYLRYRSEDFAPDKLDTVAIALAIDNLSRNWTPKPRRKSSAATKH